MHECIKKSVHFSVQIIQIHCKMLNERIKIAMERDGSKRLPLCYHSNTE